MTVRVIDSNRFALSGTSVAFVDAETGRTTRRRPLSVAPVIGATGEVVGYSTMWVQERR